MRIERVKVVDMERLKAAQKAWLATYGREDSQMDFQPESEAVRKAMKKVETARMAYRKAGQSLHYAVWKDGENLALKRKSTKESGPRE